MGSEKSNNATKTRSYKERTVQPEQTPEAPAPQRGRSDCRFQYD